MSQVFEQPQYIGLESYDDENAIRQNFAPLANVNKDHKLDNLDQSLFFVIRTQGEDNVHLAMKYGIWTSSSRKNQRLSEAFKQAQKNEGDVYLFYTEINSQCFSGVARLVSDFDPKAHFKYWLIENKWFGLFRIEWLYVKDVDFSNFESLKQNQTLEGVREVLKPVHDLVDCTELIRENGKKMLQIFESSPNTKSLFSDFKELDQKEAQTREYRINNPKFEKKFQELTKVFEQMPFQFSVNSYERKKLHRKQNQMFVQQFYYNPYIMQQYYPGGAFYPPNQYGMYQMPVEGQQYQQPIHNQQQQQQQPQYWQKDNGFYNQKYNHYQKQSHHNNNNYEQNEGQQQHQVDEDPNMNNLRLQDRFAMKGKKQKTEKKPYNNKKGGQTRYVPKEQYHQDSNFVPPPPQQESDEETVQQQEPIQ